MHTFSRRTLCKSVAAGAGLLALRRLAAKESVGPVDTLVGEEPKVDPKTGIEHRVFRPATKVNPKNGEATGINLKDGSLLIIWTEFLDVDLLPPEQRPPYSPLRGSPMSDDGYARLTGSLSRDGGRTWSEPRVFVDDPDAGVNCLHPSLTRLKDGRLLLAYSWRNGGVTAKNHGETARRARISNDEGLTWSAPVRISPVDVDYHTGGHNRAWTLPSGRVLVQCHISHPVKGPAGSRAPSFHKITYIAYSDDAGQTWRCSNEITENVSGGLNDSSLVRREDGTLLMVLRSQRGQSFCSESRDEGSTWSKARPSGVITTDAPGMLSLLPGGSDVLMTWNPNYNPDPGRVVRQAVPWGRSERSVTLGEHGVTRCPLICAVSRDGGRSWGLPLCVEGDINFEWSYPGVFFHGEHALIHYYRATDYGRDLMLTRVPLALLYRDGSA